MTSRIWLLYVLVGWATSSFASSSTSKNRENRRDRTSDQIVLQPIGLTFGSAPTIFGIDYRHQIKQSARLTHGFSVNYAKTYLKDSKTTDELSADVSLDRPTMQTASASFILGLGRSFAFTFGGGLRETKTTAKLTNNTLSAPITADKSALTLGANIGVNNRWQLADGLLIGCTWFEHFLPVHVLRGKNAVVNTPAGVSAEADDPHHDGWRMSFRVLNFEIGWVF